MVLGTQCVTNGFAETIRDKHKVHMSSWNTDCPRWRDSCDAIRPGWGPYCRDRRAGTSAQGTSHSGSSQPGVGQMALPACLSGTVHGSVVKYFGILVGKRRAGESSGENWGFQRGSIIIGSAASGLSAPEVCVTRRQVLAKRRVTLFAGDPLRCVWNNFVARLKATSQ